MTSTEPTPVLDAAAEERAKNRFPARRAFAAATGIPIAELQALSNAAAEGVAVRRALAARAARAAGLK